MPQDNSEHIRPGKLDDISNDRGELTLEEFEHIHLCPACLQAYAQAFRDRATKRSRSVDDKAFQEVALHFA